MSSVFVLPEVWASHFSLLNCNSCITTLQMRYMLSPFVLVFPTSMPTINELFANP